MTNTSIRKRFGIEEKNAALASRLLSEAIEAGLILVKDPEAGTRSRTYLPFWAAPQRSRYQAWMCTELKGKASWFLPFDRGFNDGAGNPPNPHGLVTDYLWKEILARPSLANIIENYAQVVEEEDGRGKKRRKQIFP